MDSAPVREAVRRLEADGFAAVEAYAKRGRSRKFELGPAGKLVTTSEEAGWAVRAGDQHSSFFAAGTGSIEAVEPDHQWPQGEGRPLRLPGPSVSRAWSPGSDLDAPMLVEHEALAMLESIRAELGREIPGAQLLRAVLEEGSSDSVISNSRGVHAKTKGRVATLYLEVAGSGRDTLTATRYLAAREARNFRCKSLVQHLANELFVRRDAKSGSRDRGEFLLASEVGVRLLEGLLPLLIGRDAVDVATRLEDRQGRIGSSLVTVVDDGGLAGGVLEAAVDGEGTPTKRMTLIEAGRYHQPLTPWWEANEKRLPSGCVGRASWRDLPKAGPTHLFLLPDPSVSVSSLVGAVSRGYYLLGCEGPGSFDLSEDRFSLPVWGFVLRQGKSVEPLSGSRLEGRIGALLRGIQAVGRDLMFAPLKGMIGCPSMLVTGIELRSTGS